MSRLPVRSPTVPLPPDYNVVSCILAPTYRMSAAESSISSKSTTVVSFAGVKPQRDQSYKITLVPLDIFFLAIILQSTVTLDVKMPRVPYSAGKMIAFRHLPISTVIR